MSKKKRLKELEERVCALENSVGRLRGELMLNSSANTFDFGNVTLEGLCQKLPGYIDNKIKAVVTANNNRSDS